MNKFRAGNEPIIDETALVRIHTLQTPGAPSVVAEVIEMFNTTTPPKIEKIFRALAEKDLEQFCKAAHALKSSTLTLGAQKMSAICQEMEALESLSEIEEIRKLAEELKMEFSNACVELNKLSSKFK